MNHMDEIREAAKASSEPLFRCDDYGVCEYDFILDGRCLHCGALGPPDQLEFLTRRLDRFELVTSVLDMDTSPAENHALRGVLDTLEERDSKLISEEGSLDSPVSRIARLSTSADILEMSREHLDDTAYAALESGLREIDSRDCPWEEAIQIEAAKGWWLPDDDVETIRKTMPHSSQCYCDACLPQRQKEQVKRDKSPYTSMTKAELRALLEKRDFEFEFENETKAELIELLMLDDSRNSFPMLVITILAVIGCIGIAVAYWPLVVLALAIIIPGYVYAKLTGRGEMAEQFSIEKIGADPDAPPEGWHDKPKKEVYPSSYLSAVLAFWRDPYFLLGFSVPILYLIYGYQNMLWFEQKYTLSYIVMVFITHPFFGDPKESPFVRAGTGVHIATVAIIALAIALGVLSVILGVLILFWFVESW